MYRSKSFLKLLVDMHHVQLSFFSLVFSQIENDVEDKLRQKFTLSDRADAAAMGGAQQVSIVIFVCKWHMQSQIIVAGTIVKCESKDSITKPP